MKDVLKCLCRSLSIGVALTILVAEINDIVKDANSTDKE